LDPNPPEWLSNFNLFVVDSNPILVPMISSVRLKPNWNTLYAGKPPGYEIFYQVPAASRMSQRGEATLRRQAYNGWPNKSKMIWFTMTNRPHSPAYTNLLQAIDSHYLVNNARKFPMNLAHLNTGNKAELKSDSSKSDSKSSKGSSNSN